MLVSLASLEDAINRCKEAQPFEGCVLPPDLRHMGDIYGTMIYRRVDTLDLSIFSEAAIKAVTQWMVR